jgi:hypothetical protein
VQQFLCEICGAGKAGRNARSGGVAPPAGWKRLGGSLRCGSCAKSAYVIRAVALPVWGVLEGGSEAEFRDAAKEALRMSTDLWNWSTRQLLQRDVTRTPGAARMPPPPKVELYRLYNEAGCPCGDVAAKSRTAIFQMAQAHYARCRHGAVWLGKESLPLKRYPAPFPVPAQDWEALLVGERPALPLRLHGKHSGPRWLVRLAGGAPFRRQLAAFRQVASGEAERCQLDLYTQPCGQGERGLYLSFRETSGGQRIPCRLMAKLVARFPRAARPEGEATLHLRADPEAFWVAEVGGRCERPWLLNGDHLFRSMAMMRQWQARHAAWLQRVGEDRKHEKRWPLGQRRQFADAYARRCEKHRRRVDAWVSQMVAQLLGFARRRGVGTIAYCDDGPRPFPEAFPWSRLKATLKQRCDAAGVALIAGGQAADETPGAARVPEEVA